MCSSLFLMLSKSFPESDAVSLHDYFSSLTGNAIHSITASKASRALHWDNEKTLNTLRICSDLGILDRSYSVRCPECGMLIDRYKDLEEISDDSIICYNCETAINLSADNIEIIYSINPSFFPTGQSEKNTKQNPTEQIAQIDTLSALIRSGNKNDFFFNPTEAEYLELQQLYNLVFTPSQKAKEKGNSLETLCIELFKKIKSIRVASVSTITNQIDLYVRNLVLGVVPLPGERVVIECKNEKKAPGNTYFHKITGIIDGINGGGNRIVQLGIIISLRSPAKTIWELATLKYARDGIVIVSITVDELREIIFDRINLLELIERKREEVILNTNTDLQKIGVFDA